MHDKLLLIIMVFIKIGSSIDYAPASQIIDVIELGEYTFGINKTVEIKTCSFSSDTGISESFNISKSSQKHNSDDLSMKSNRNVVSNFGIIGLCQLNVKYVDENGPSTWDLKFTYNNSSKGHATFKVNFFYKAPLLIDNVVVLESESFLQYINFTEEIVYCYLTFGTTQMELNLNSHETVYAEEDNDTAKKVSSLGDRCGFLLENATSAEALEWALTATNKYQKSYRATFKSVILNKVSNDTLNRKIEVVVGESGYISCGSKTDHVYCYMFNSKNVLMPTKDCTYWLKTVSMEDIGIWKCFAGIRQSMQTLSYSIELIVKDYERVETWITETEKYITIGCRITNKTFGGLMYCSMVAPDGKNFNLYPGAVFNRYLALGTDFKKANCEMKIKKPLQDFEHGQWQCHIGAPMELTGGFINVGNVKDIAYRKYQKVITQMGQNLIISCEVPYSSEYCYVQAPDGTIFPSYSEHQTRLGRCTLSIDKVDLKHNGIWKCAFSRDMGEPDDEIIVQVFVAETLTESSMVQVNSGESIQLMCTTTGLPVKYCRFVSPQGVSYYIHNHQNSSRISYYGKGLEYGDCGVRIEQIKVTDGGNWTCVTRIGRSYRQSEIFATIQVTVAPNLITETNFLLGLGIGISLLTVLIGIIVMMLQRKASFNRNGVIRASEENVSYHSEVDMFSLGEVNYASTSNNSHVHQQ